MCVIDQIDPDSSKKPSRSPQMASYGRAKSPQWLFLAAFSQGFGQNLQFIRNFEIQSFASKFQNSAGAKLWSGCKWSAVPEF